MTSNPWPRRVCRGCYEDVADPGWYQCGFCRHVDASKSGKARVPPELAGLADAYRRARLRGQLLRGRQRSGVTAGP